MSNYLRRATFRARTVSVLLLTVCALVVGVTSVAQAAPRPATAVAATSAHAPKPEDFSPYAASSPDVVVTGYGDAAGYHLQVGREASGFAWHEIALLHPAGSDESSWTGYQCVSGDGRYAAVTILPASVVNLAAARDHGGLAYSVDLGTGAVRAIASGVGLMYFSPGCGTGEQAVFTLNPGAGQTSTQLVTADLATGKVSAATTVAGQITSTVPTSGGLLGVAGGDLVAVSAKGTTKVVAKIGGSPFDVHPAADGGVDLLDAHPGSLVSVAEHARAGVVTTLGSGPVDRLQMFGGRAGRAVLSGATRTDPDTLAAAAVRVVDDHALPHGAQMSSVDGDMLLGASTVAQQTDPVVLATATARLMTDARAPTSAKAVTAVPTYRASGATGGAQPETGVLRPRGDAAGSSNQLNTAATPTPGTAVPNKATPATAQSPTCAVPRLDTAKQVMQPSPAQVDWAAQMAEQGLLTGAAYTRPTGFDNLGLAAYAPNSDFPLITLSHPSGSTWNTVPRPVFEAIMAQESNFDQASFHSPEGVSGNPLIADYYGAGGDITSINYAGSDCGYGVSQVTTGMRVGDTSLTAHGQIKVAVDYQENIAAGLQILETTWNQLFAAGILVNNGDPKYLENWFLAAWAYNSGIQPNAANGNTTGCTPGPTCTGPDGTWGLGWANNPENPSYPPNRDPFLKDTQADAAHPGNWPYEERIMGWMASPIIRYGNRAFAKAMFNGGQTWMQIPPVTTFCTVANDHCDPTTTNPTEPDAGHCQLADFECWWHQPVTWIPSCATTCATSTYAFTAGSTEPGNPDPEPPTCNQDTSVVPSNAIIVDDEPSPPLNLQGCANENWTSKGSFTYTYGTNAAGDPIGAIDTHQLGTGLGGHILFTHTETGSNPNLINTGTWTPALPSLQYYKIKLHFPGAGAEATNVVYTINPGGGAAPWKIRVNQAWNSEQWATIGTFALENGATVVLTNKSAVVDPTSQNLADFDVAFDAVAFVPMGGTPGQPIGGPPGVRDEPDGSNPAFIQCGCARRTAGDPVDTATGYFGQTWTDLSTPGRGEPLDFTRTYTEATADPSGPNGSLAVDGPFGFGWTDSYNLSSTTDATTGNVTVHQEDGSQVSFIDSGGTYTTAQPRYDATLTASGTNYVYTRRGQNIFTFDKTTGHLTREQDLAGAKASPAYATTLAYDTSGHLHTITDPGGRVYTLTYTGNHITQLSDSASRVVTYAYDSAGNLTDVLGVGTTRTPSVQNNDHEQYTYTTAHLMASMRTPNNFGGPASAVTSMTYDASERVTAQTDPLGHTTTFGYGPNATLSAGQTLVTDPVGHQTLDTYTNGLLTSETKGNGTADAGTWSYTYDPVTLGVSTETDPDGNLTTYSYDDHGNKTSESNGLGVTTNYLYDNNDDLVETIDGNGVATINQYDQSGHIPTGAAGVLDLTSTAVTQANNVVESTTGNFGAAPIRTTNYFYDDVAHPGDRTRVTSPNGNTTTTTYDSFGDTASVTDPAGDKTAYGYDTARDLLTSTVDPNGTAAAVGAGCTPPAKGCTTYAHDAWGHVTLTTDPLGHTSASTFDADGNKTSDTDANSRTISDSYDAADRLVRTTLADGTTQVTDFNGDGTVADTVDGLGKKTVYGYDGQVRQISSTDPDSRTITSHIDPAGRVVTSTDPAGRVTTMGYDPAGQLTSVSYSDGVTHGTTYGYDPDGNKVSTTDGTGTSAWVYDTFNEVAQQTQGSGATVSYAHDNDGNETSITYPGQAVAVTRTFDTADRLASVTDQASNKTSFTYNGDSQVLTTHYPNGATVTNGFDNSDAIMSTAAVTGTTTVLSAGYNRDPVGQVQVQTVGSAAQNYGYTAREQLSSVTSGGVAVSYAQDAANNPIAVGASTQSFDAAGQLCWSITAAVSNPSCATVPTGATKYTFNSLGERAAATPATGTASAYGYDQAGRLTSFTGPNGSASYSYDADGLRVAKTAGGTTSTFVWDDASVPDVLADGTNTYLYGPEGLPIEQVGASASYWLVHDQIGSTLGLLDNTGHVAGSYTYTPYGVATHSGTATTPMLFTGQYTDAESGLVYLRARYYDPATAQFLTVDPEVGVTRTPYAYVNDNPLNASDPTGNCGWDTVSVRSANGSNCYYAMGTGVCNGTTTHVGSSGESQCQSSYAAGSCGQIRAQGQRLGQSVSSIFRTVAQIGRDINTLVRNPSVRCYSHNISENFSEGAIGFGIFAGPWGGAAGGMGGVLWGVINSVFIDC
jgi:RHS repeat-associated protein